VPLLSLCSEAPYRSGFVNPTVFNIEDAVSMDKAIKAHADAMDAVAPFIPHISWRAGSLPYPKWKGPTDHFFKYCPYRNALNKVSIYNACGNGFAIGALAAGINNLISSKTVDKRVFAGALLSSIAAVFYQNHAWGKIPYYSADAKLCDNYFETINANSSVRCLVSMLCTGCGFFGTKYLLDRTSEQYAEFVKNNEDPLNELL
jgi:hypothetical protein